MNLNKWIESGRSRARPKVEPLMAKRSAKKEPPTPEKKFSPPATPEPVAFVHVEEEEEEEEEEEYAEPEEETELSAANLLRQFHGGDDDVYGHDDDYY